MNDYYELLEEPQWKVKARDIKERDGKKCTVCSSTKKLCVHHTYYIMNLKPWEYPNESLITLCKNCHEDHHRHFENVIKPNIKNKPNKKTKKRIKNLPQSKFKAGTTYRKVTRRIFGEMKTVLRKV